MLIEARKTIFYFTNKTLYIFRIWPNYVKSRLQNTYAYLASGVALTAAAGVVGARSPLIMSIATRGSLMV